MNNLKRVLSLGLSGVMLAGLLTVGASAADFTDGDKIEHADAVNTLVALNVVAGKEDGSYFDPEGNVTRAEMAKMIAVAMNGGNDTATGVKTTPSFSDIKGHWAESYIEYCADLDIISGRGDGTFDPGANVTGMEAAKMILTALGYNAEAYQLVGDKWSTRTDQLAQAAQPVSLYEDLPGVSMNAPATRDVAAQMIWNGLQDRTVKVIPDTSLSTGEISWQYQTSGTKTLLAERYGADIFVGTYKGNYASGKATNKGEIRVDGLNEGETGNAKQASFPSDMSIENIGEEVKVIYKDAKTGGSTGKPDKADKIYGVFNTGKTNVYNITKNDIQDVDTANGKVKFDDTKYDYLTGGVYQVNYGVTSGTLTDSTMSGLKKSTADSIKFICDDNGKIIDAYVTERTFDVVSAVTSTKVSLYTNGTLTIADHDVYDDIAKDDVVMLTKLYKAAAKDATYIVEKAEILTGEVTKFYSATKIDVDGKTINADENVTSTLLNQGEADFDTAAMANTALGNEWAFVMYGKRFISAKALTETDKDYAVIITANKGDDINGQSVKLLLADGTTKTFVIDEESKVGNTTMANYYETTPTTNLDDTTNTHNLLVSYTIQNDGKVKMTALTTSGSNHKGTYTKNTKSLGTQEGTFVTTADAVAFVYFDGTSTGGTKEWKAYKAADLNDITGLASTGFDVQYKLDSNNNTVPVFAIQATAAVGVNTSDYAYMFITANPGAYTKDGSKYTDVTGVTVGGEEVTITLENDQTSETKLAKGSFIQYKEGANNLVALNDVKAVNTVGRVKDFDTDRRILVLDGGAVLPMSKDMVIINVNTADTEAGVSTGLSTADPVNTTYQNVVYLRDASDVTNGQPIIAIFVDDNKKIEMNTQTFTSGTPAAVQTALYAGNVTVDKATITGAITVPAGKTLTISDAPTATELAYLTAEEGAKVVIKAQASGITASGWYKNAGSANTATGEGATDNSKAAVALSNNTIAADTTFEGKLVYEGSDGSATLGTTYVWVATDAAKIS